MERAPIAALRRYGIDIALLSGCAALALRYRLELLDAAAIGSDAINPYLKAWLVLAGGTLFPQGPFPESGYIVAYTFLPYLWVAGSLRSALRARFILNALGFIPIYLGLKRFARPPGLSTTAAPAMAAALLMALSPGLADTLLTGYQTFDVSLYATLPTVGALWISFRRDAPRALWLVLPWLPVLAMLHPYAIVYAVGALWLIGLLWRRAGAEEVRDSGELEPPPRIAQGAELPALTNRRHHLKRALIASSAVAFLLALPQLYRYRVMSTGRPDGLLGYLSTIAHSPGQFDTLHGVLRKVAIEEMLSRDLFPHGLMLAAPLLTLALLPFYRRSADRSGLAWLNGVGAFSGWTLLGQLAMIALAALVHYLQPYHLRVLFPPMAVQLALLLAMVTGGSSPASEGRRLRRWLPALLMWVACALIARNLIEDRFPPPPASRGTLAGAEEISRLTLLDGSPRPVVIEYLHLSNDLAGYPGAVALDQLLAGVPESHYLRSTPEQVQARYFFALTGQSALLERVAAVSEGTGVVSIRHRSPSGDLLLLRIDGLTGVRRWSALLCGVLPPGFPVHLGGANDYLGVLNRQHDTAMERAWFADCLMAGRD
jgi:hypothetical protein